MFKKWELRFSLFSANYSSSVGRHNNIRMYYKMILTLSPPAPPQHDQPSTGTTPPVFITITSFWPRPKCYSPPFSCHARLNLEKISKAWLSSGILEQDKTPGGRTDTGVGTQYRTRQDTCWENRNWGWNPIQNKTRHLVGDQILMLEPNTPGGRTNTLVGTQYTWWENRYWGWNPIQNKTRQLVGEQILRLEPNTPGGRTDTKVRNQYTW